MHPGINSCRSLGEANEKLVKDANIELRKN
jgi:hypothetical protein